MPMTSRWTAIAPSQFPWEREALEWLREHLPDCDPWYAWSNFEFIDEAGRVNEIDNLILSPVGLFLVEIKSRPGTLTGDAHTWTWVTQGSGEDRRFTDDNPLILADRKAKRLASLLKRQLALLKSGIRLPWVQPLIWIEAAGTRCRLDPAGRVHVHGRGQPGRPGDDGIIAALTGAAGGGSGEGGASGRPGHRPRHPQGDRRGRHPPLEPLPAVLMFRADSSRRSGDYPVPSSDPRSNSIASKGGMRARPRSFSVAMTRQSPPSRAWATRVRSSGQISQYQGTRWRFSSCGR